MTETFLNTIQYTPKSEQSVPYDSSPWSGISDDYIEALDAAAKMKGATVPIATNRTIPTVTLNRLLNDDYIDDIAIDEWGRMLSQRAKDDSRYRSLVVMSTHWPTLVNKPKCPVDEFKLIMFPIHIVNHWILIWLDLIEECLYVYDPLKTGPGSDPCADSWDRTVQPILDMIVGWFNEQALFVRQFETHCVRRPFQSDMVNCGVWVAMMEDSVSRDLWLCELADWDTCPTLPFVARRRIASSIIMGKLQADAK